MRTKNAKAISKDERAHLEKVKSMPCVVCGHSSPSDAHHIEQGLHYTTIPLCKDCHQGSKNGIHGQRHMWKVMKMDELKALNETIRMLMYRGA